MRRVPALALMLLLSSAGVQAQVSDAREEAINLASVTVAHELCGFELSGAEEDLIARRRDGLVEGGAITPAELADIEAELAVSMKRQVSEGLCRPSGGAARFYRHTLDGLARH